jgi:hypothetical protein
MNVLRILKLMTCHYRLYRCPETARQVNPYSFSYLDDIFLVFWMTPICCKAAMRQMHLASDVPQLAQRPKCRAKPSVMILIVTAPADPSRTAQRHNYVERRVERWTILANVKPTQPSKTRREASVLKVSWTETVAWRHAEGRKTNSNL